MAVKHFKRVAVDTNVMLDYALPKDVVQEAVAQLRVAPVAFQFFVPPTVFEELSYLAIRAEDIHVKKLSERALGKMLEWEFHPQEISPLDRGFTRNAATKIVDGGLIDPDEENDAIIFAEAAFMKCDFLITGDKHLLSIDERKISHVMKGCDADCPIIISPQGIVKALCPKRR